jgi:H+/Cl- antiporter ClcA
MSISAQTKPPRVVKTPGGTLFSDFVIGGCLGSILGVVLSAFFPEFPGLIGVPCVVIGALIGTVVNRVRHNVDLETPVRDNTETSLLSRDDYVLLDAATSFARNRSHSRSLHEYLQRLKDGTERALTFDEVFPQ